MSPTAALKILLFPVFATTLIFGCVTDPDTPENGQNGQSSAGNREPAEVFTVTEEVYTQTFDEIGDLIKRLNKIIATTNYAEWKKYLSKSYASRFGDPAVLKEYSETPILKENKIVLKNLYDYFMWVVVPSRSNVRLDEIVFLDENQLIAYMIIENKKTILYQLEKIDGKWKISTW